MAGSSAFRKKRLETQVVVHVAIEVCVPDTWGSDCTLAQVHKQAGESAKRLLNKVIFGEAKEHEKNRIGITGVKIHGITTREVE
jgi:hypothetical protein